jgi:enoyl-CoA hydratase/carnithine racemase
MLPRLGGSTLPRAAGSMGMYLGLTGARLKGAADWLTTGLATHYVGPNQWTALVQALQSDVLAGPSTPASEVKANVARLLNRFHELPATTAPHLTRNVLALIEECFGSHVTSVEHVLTQLDAVASGKLHLTPPALPASAPTGPLDPTAPAAPVRLVRGPLNPAEQADMAKLAGKLAADLRTKSPMALKVTFRALRENAKKHLGDALVTEFRLGLRTTAHHDVRRRHISTTSPK